MQAIHRAIGNGELYQLNYTAPLRAEFDGDPRAWFMALRKAQPSGYAAFIDTGDEQVLSVSPELFFDWHGDRILARPMKGTAPRGTTTAEDEAPRVLLTGSESASRARCSSSPAAKLKRRPNGISPGRAPIR